MGDATASSQRVQLRDLDTFVKIISALDKDQFVEQYPGFYLLAMGFLSAEQIAAGNPMSALARQQESQRTLPMRFGDHPRHAIGKPHPLAGHLFHVRDRGDEGTLTLGRVASCDLAIPDESVSEVHCRLQVLPEGLVVADLDSTNGTSINLQRLTSEEVQLLADGDMLTVGRYSFQLLFAGTLYSTLSLICALDEG